MSDMISHGAPDPLSQDDAAFQPAGPAPQPRLRLWPAVILLGLQWLCMTVPSWLAPGTMLQFFGMFISPMVGAAGFLIWWLFFSRLRWRERWLTLLACAVIGAVAFVSYHSSFGIFGVILYALPAVTTAWLLWLLATPFLRWPARRTGLLVVFALGWGAFALVRFEGVYGDFSATFRLRSTPTAEEVFLAERAGHKDPAADDDIVTYVELQPGDWPGFRGPKRDARLTGAQIATDWQQRPPQQVWRQRVGPGWSSFAVVGNRLYTQEQRGPAEVVVCYNADTGAERWLHRDAARFTELVGGPGPRATPTFHEGKIYTMGATGILNCLDAATGRKFWSRDIVADSGAKVPEWGFAASPLVAQNIVTVYAGAEGKSVLGYHASSGEPAWSAGDGNKSYCSPHLARLAGVEQVLIATNEGLTSFHPVGGAVLWHHSWPSENVARVTQPAILEEDVLIGTAFTLGTRRLHLSHDNDSWNAREVWTKTAIKPYYNDLVVHGEHLYGFDGVFFTCLRLEDGKTRWRARGYGNGQVLLLADQDLLLITSEFGEVSLVEASPDRHNELARFQAIEGKTWNHPVVAHGKLYVRNGDEAACYQLTAK
jgi:outer membrane protein assembly factor BamB